MIVTRRRRRQFRWKRYLYPAAAMALLAAALSWGPSRNWITAGPVTAPAWHAAQPVVRPLTRPFDMAAQQGTIRAQQTQIDSLQQQIAALQAQIAGRDKRITDLTSELDQAEQDAAIAKASRPAPASAAKAAASAAAGDLSQNATPDMRRTAQIWQSMDAESAAALVRKLPDAYVARIFALMPPDAVGAVLENVPAAYAARLTQEHPELKR